MTKHEALDYIEFKVRDDEEVFILKARDMLAVPTVFYWATLAEKHEVNLKKVRSAWECAEKMAGFTNRRIPD